MTKPTLLTIPQPLRLKIFHELLRPWKHLLPRPSTPSFEPQVSQKEQEIIIHAVLLPSPPPLSTSPPPLPQQQHSSLLPRAKVRVRGGQILQLHLVCRLFHSELKPLLSISDLDFVFVDLSREALESWLARMTHLQIREIGRVRVGGWGRCLREDRVRRKGKGKEEGEKDGGDGVEGLGKLGYCERVIRVDLRRFREEITGRGLKCTREGVLVGGSRGFDCEDVASCLEAWDCVRNTWCMSGLDGKEEEGKCWRKHERGMRRVYRGLRCDAGGPYFVAQDLIDINALALGTYWGETPEEIMAQGDGYAAEADREGGGNIDEGVNLDVS